MGDCIVELYKLELGSQKRVATLLSLRYHKQPQATLDPRGRFLPQGQTRSNLLVQISDRGVVLQSKKCGGMEYFNPDYRGESYNIIVSIENLDSYSKVHRWVSSMLSPAALCQRYKVGQLYAVACRPSPLPYEEPKLGNLRVRCTWAVGMRVGIRWLSCTLHQTSIR